MMQQLSDEQLLKQTIEAAANERRALIELIKCFAEIDRRKLFATHYSSMFEYAMRELKMSEGQAQRRIDAARLYRELPEIAERITKGTINLMHLSLARKYQRHEKRAKRTPDLRELLQELEGKSTREAEKLIALKTGEDQRRAIRLLPTEEQRERLEKVRALWAHRIPDGDWTEIVVAMAELTLKQIDPLNQKPPRTASAGGKKRTRYISAQVKHAAWQKSQGRCEYIAPDGRRCNSRHALEFDHVEPFAMGGDQSRENIRVLCRAHNLYRAREIFGAKMADVIANRGLWS